MVMGHSGSPGVLSRFLYLFHMPLFFLCSGYFFNEVPDTTSFALFFRKKIKGLYLPYLKWSLLFLVLHNLFFQINIYNSLTHSYFYSTSDFLKQLVKTIFMTDFELLLRPFWFIKELLFASILIAMLSLIRAKVFPKLRNELLLFFMFLCTIVCKYTKLHLPIIGDCSVLTLSSVYFYSGIIFRKIEHNIPKTYWLTSIAFLSTIIGSYYFIGEIDMRYTTIYNLIPYYLLSISGIIMTFNISKWINNISINTYLYYIGNHTMPILTLNLLALKVGNYLKILIYNMSIEELSSHTIIFDNNSYFWIVYIVIGTFLPLIVDRLLNIIDQKALSLEKKEDNIV